MKLIIFLIVVTFPFTLFGEGLTKISLNELLTEDESSLKSLDISLEEMKRVSGIIQEYEPDIITFNLDIDETSVKQLVYTLHSKGLTQYHYYYLEREEGIIQKGELTF